MPLPSSALATLTITATLIRVAALTGVVFLLALSSSMVASPSTTGAVPAFSHQESVMLAPVHSRYAVELAFIVRF
jgi:hypothetical protein